MKLSDGEKVELWRRRIGWTQTRFAVSHGCTQETISAWELDRASVPLSVLRFVRTLRPSRHELVRVRRRRLGLTMAEMALAVRRSRMSVWKAENGHGAGDTLKRMERWLNPD